MMLKVRFAEADRSKLTAFGINLFSTGATNTIGTVSTQQFGAQGLNTQNSNGGTLTQFNFSDLLNIFLFRPDINLGATIKDLQQKQVLQILAEPEPDGDQGQPAHFLAGGEFPYPVVQNSVGRFPDDRHPVQALRSKAGIHRIYRETIRSASRSLQR